MEKMRRCYPAGDVDAATAAPPSPRPWAELPVGILAKILWRINPDTDFTNFTSVCKAWRAAAVDGAPPGGLPPTVRRLCGRLARDAWRGRRGRGDAHSQSDIENPGPSPSAVHAFTAARRSHISRRTESTKPDRIFGSGLILQPAKKGSDCVALAIYGWSDNKLAYARPGDAAWTILSWDWKQFANKWGPFEDAVYYKGQFYVINLHGAVMRCIPSEVPKSPWRR
uniref:KIB1-4 beta-propeller domain-containing protein n=1 Tax=Ananas comosus var. bracteatus TaxID=296719 RepID=A0A6V7Q2I2_ANACO|nr:unnamed protein product [Ananas comosus var. bracteatus]